MIMYIYVYTIVYLILIANHVYTRLYSIDVYRYWDRCLRCLDWNRSELIDLVGQETQDLEMDYIRKVRPRCTKDRTAPVTQNALTILLHWPSRGEKWKDFGGGSTGSDIEVAK